MNNNNQKKIESIILYILQHFQNRLSVDDFYKILYSANKYFLANFGKSIYPDKFYADESGPIPAMTQKKQTKLIDFNVFSKSISIEKNVIIAKQKPNTDYLSKMECIYLDKYCIDNNIEYKDSAYDAALLRGKADPIKRYMTIIEIAKAGGASEKMVSYIEEIKLFF